MQFLKNRARESRQTKFVQCVQNPNTVKTRLVFPTIDQNAEILSTGFNDSFSGYSHRVPALIFEEIILVKIFSSMPPGMPKLENFLNHKAKIIFEIAWHF